MEKGRRCILQDRIFFPWTPPLRIPHKAVISSVLSSLLSPSAPHLTGDQLAVHIIYAFYVGNKSGGCTPASLPVAPVTCMFVLLGPGRHFSSNLSSVHSQRPPHTTMCSQTHKNNFAVNLTCVGSHVTQQSNRPIFF